MTNSEEVGTGALIGEDDVELVREMLDGDARDLGTLINEHAPDGRLAGCRVSAMW
jgi:hypothetical protein